MKEEVEVNYIIESNLNELKKEYELKKHNYSKLLQEVKKEMETLVQQYNINLGFSIETRVKKWSSIVGKIESKSLRLFSVEEVTDLAGIRIVSLFEDDILRVNDLIGSNFDIIEEENTAERLGLDQFGYGSLHYLVKIKDEWTNLPSMRDLSGLVFEVQLRTASQHLWAIASHLLQYKTKTDIPRANRRSINRAAALLETIDIEFNRIQKDKIRYLNEQNDPNEVLNVLSLYKILSEKRFGKRLIGDDDLSNLLNDLKVFGILTISDLESLLEENVEISPQENLYMNGVVRRILANNFEEEWTLYLADKYPK